VISESESSFSNSGSTILPKRFSTRKGSSAATQCLWRPSFSKMIKVPDYIFFVLDAFLRTYPTWKKIKKKFFLTKIPRFLPSKSKNLFSNSQKEENATFVKTSMRCIIYVGKLIFGHKMIWIHPNSCFK